MDSSQKEVLVSAAATSTTAANSTAVKVGAAHYHTLYLYWTPGATNNVLTIKVWYSSDGDEVASGSETWAQEGTWTLAAGTKTFAVYTLTHTAVDTAQVKLYYNLDISAVKRMKITYSESVSAGTLTSHLLSRTY